LRPAVSAVRKVRKIAFFTVFALPGGVTLADRLLITKTHNWVTCVAWWQIQIRQAIFGNFSRNSKTPRFGIM